MQTFRNLLAKGLSFKYNHIKQIEKKVIKKRIMHSNFSLNDIFVSMLTFKKIIRIIFVNIIDLDPNTYLQSIFLMLIFNFHII